MKTLQLSQCKERIAAHKNTVDESEIMKFISWLKTPIDALPVIPPLQRLRKNMGNVPVDITHWSSKHPQLDEFFNVRHVE